MERATTAATATASTEREAAYIAADRASTNFWSTPANCRAVAPAPPAPPRPPANGNCHPNYSPCLPIVDDLDCGEIPERNIRVIGADPYRLDGSDNDGIGCEA